MTVTDPFNLERFVAAQASAFAPALAELKTGRKRTHWIWYIFPQLRGLGRSSTAQFYGIGSLDEARAYLGHPLLGSRLAFCTETVLGIQAPSLHEIFGSPDDRKFRSSMTLFQAASVNWRLFQTTLEQWCEGQGDERTLALLTNPDESR